MIRFSFSMFLLVVMDTVSWNLASFKRSSRLHAPEQVLADGLDAQQTEVLKEVVRTMMGFSGGTSPAESSPSRHEQQRAPRYMHRLYEKFLTGELVRTHSQVADTVRNINPELAVVSNSSLYVFNLSSLEETEIVLRAEIHILKRRFKADTKSKDMGTIIVKVYELGPRILRERASFRLPESGHSRWHVFDVTTPIRSFPSAAGNEARPGQRMLAVSFVDGGGNPGSSVNLRMSRVLRWLSKPALVVFSQDNNRKKNVDANMDTIFKESEDIEDDSSDTERETWSWNHENPLRFRGRQHPVKPRGRTAGRPRVPKRILEERGTPMLNLSNDEIFEMESFSNHEPNGKSNGRAFHRQELEEEIGVDARGKFFHAGFSPNLESTSTESAHRRRKKRLIVDNEVLHEEEKEEEKEEERKGRRGKEVEASDDEPVMEFHYSGPPNTNPGILNGRVRSGKRRPASTATPVSAFGEDGEEEEDKEDRVKRRRRKEDRRAREEEDSSLSTAVSHLGINRKRSERTRRRACRRKSLLIDFGDIGWKDWIISPDFFEAHYCDGTCAYPMSSSLHPTNHATIQGIVKAIGLQAKVPSPCCVPSSLSSVTLLYFDRNQNVVLKNFPDMTVRSCACR